MGILLLMLLAGVEGTTRWKEETRWKETVHQLKVNDCNIPVSLKQYTIPEHCLMSGISTFSTTQERLPGTIIIKERINTISGAVCVAKKSQFRGHTSLRTTERERRPVPPQPPTRRTARGFDTMMAARL